MERSGRYPNHVLNDWLGHSGTIAETCCLQTTEDDDAEALPGTAEPKSHAASTSPRPHPNPHQSCHTAVWQSLTGFHVGFTKLGNDLIHCVTFLRHSESPFRAVRAIKILSLTMVQFYGRGH